MALMHQAAEKGGNALQAEDYVRFNRWHRLRRPPRAGRCFPPLGRRPPPPQAAA